MKKTALESGQALVLVLLALAVTLTVTLFILSRSVTDVTVSSSQESSLRAFSAAEAGVEKSIVTYGTESNIPIGNASYSTTVSDFGPAFDEGVTNLVFNTPYSFLSGESATLWFVSHDKVTGNIVCDATHVCFADLGADLASELTQNFLWLAWGALNAPSTGAGAPAVELTLFYTTTPLDYTTIKVGRVTLDPWFTACPGTGRNCLNSFAQANVGDYPQAGVHYKFSKILTPADFGITNVSWINQPGNLQFLRVRMLYNTTEPYGVGLNINFTLKDPVPPASNFNAKLPSQGQYIYSTGTSADSTRKLSVFQGWPEIPSIFENTIYSASGIVK